MWSSITSIAGSRANGISLPVSIVLSEAPLWRSSSIACDMPNRTYQTKCARIEYFAEETAVCG